MATPRYRAMPATARASQRTKTMSRPTQPGRHQHSPLLIAVECMVAIGLCALLYLSQVSAVEQTNQALQAAQAQQDTLRQQDAELHLQLGQVQSPAYVDQQARALGLVPPDPETR